MTENSLTSTFDKHAATYDTSVYLSMFQHDYFIKLKCVLIINFIKKQSLSNSYLADFGCGTGEVISILSPFVKYCYGIDSSAEMIKIALNKLIPNATFFQRDCNISGLADNSVNLVISMSLLHHVDGFSNKVRILKEMKRVVKPDGFILVFEHNPWNPITRLIFQREPVDRDARMISTAYMKKLCDSAGYEKFFINHIAFFPKRLKKLSRFEPVFGWVPFGGQYVTIAHKQ